MEGDVTVKLSRAEFGAVTNLLQLIVVMKIDLWMKGLPQPKHDPLISVAFDKFCRAGMPNQNEG